MAGFTAADVIRCASAREISAAEDTTASPNPSDNNAAVKNRLSKLFINPSLKKALTCMLQLNAPELSAMGAPNKLLIRNVLANKVVGRSMQPHMQSSLVTDALKMAWSRRHRAPGLIFHSDRGSQYCGHEYQVPQIQHRLHDLERFSIEAHSYFCVRNFTMLLSVINAVSIVDQQKRRLDDLLARAKVMQVETRCQTVSSVARPNTRHWQRQ